MIDADATSCLADGERLRPSRGFDFSLSAAVQGVAEFLTQAGASTATLCFPCASAYVGLGVAAARPDLVGSLVLSQAPSFEGALAWKHGRDPKGVLNRPIIGQIAMHLLKARRLPAWFSLAISNPREREWITRVASEHLRNGSRWSLSSAFQRFLVEGAEPPRVRQPVIALWGLQDGSHTTTNRESSHALGTQVKLHEWSDVGHFPDLEAPERFAELVLATQS